MIADIAHSTDEQASGLQQVNGVVTDMDKMTQQNAAMVEQSTAASRSLADEAATLSALVEKFEISRQAQTGPSAPKRSVAVARPAPQIRGNLALAHDPDWNEF
jgi:methyl-accepting chemotaxis protein